MYNLAKKLSNSVHISFFGKGANLQRLTSKLPGELRESEDQGLHRSLFHCPLCPKENGAAHILL